MRCGVVLYITMFVYAEGGETCAYTQRRKFKWSAEEDNLVSGKVRTEEGRGCVMSPVAFRCSS